jgi:hypothetical protein
VHWQQEIAPRFTVRKLAELVARKARVPSFEPVTILGSRCEPAGAFLGLCSLPEARRQRLAPSTPLRAIRSSRRLRELWKRAEWINDVKLPQLAEPSPWRFRSAADVAQLVVCCTAAVAAAGSACLIWQIGTWFFAGLAAVMAGIVTLIVGDAVVDRIHDPLPREVQRFGDLARLISAQRRRPT